VLLTNGYFIMSKTLKNKLTSGDISVGSWVSLYNTAIAEILANAGFDWIVIDLEHSVISIDQAAELIRTVGLSGSVPLVRLTSNNSNQIKRVMDAGAHGIVVPMVNSPEDAKNAVFATRYAPKGNRGVGLARAQGYGADFKKYLTWQEEGPIVILQIEHIDALPKLEGIMSVEGVDGYIIGPYDLSCSMGIPGDFNNPIFLRTIDKIKAAGLRMNCPSGIHVVEPDPAKLQEAINTGFKFIAYSVDIRMLDVASRKGLAVLNKDKSL